VRFHIILRVYEYTNNVLPRTPINVFMKIWFRSLSLKLGFSIPPNVFDEGLCIVHYGTVIVSPFSRVGKNCRVHAGVNIGGKAGQYSIDEAKSLAPTIGENVYIGPGAKIFGGVKIASNCSIGANSVVNKSFEIEHQTIVGIPGRAIK